MFYEVIRQVSTALAPVDDEVFLSGPVTHLVELHVNCLGPFLANSVIGKFIEAHIVRLDGHSWPQLLNFCGSCADSC